MIFEQGSEGRAWPDSDGAEQLLLNEAARRGVPIHR